MIVVHVHVQVKAGDVAAFESATMANARASVLEPGIVRFDVLREADDPARWLLVEIYRTADDPARHKGTAHYATWRDLVEPMMAVPRRSVRYAAAFPDAPDWERSATGA